MTFAPTDTIVSELGRQTPDNEDRRLVSLSGRDRLAEGEKPRGVAQLCKAPRGLPRTMNARARRMTGALCALVVGGRRGTRLETPYTHRVGVKDTLGARAG